MNLQERIAQAAEQAKGKKVTTYKVSTKQEVQTIAQSSAKKRFNSNTIVMRILHIHTRFREVHVLRSDWSKNYYKENCEILCAKQKAYRARIKAKHNKLKTH